VPKRLPDVEVIVRPRASVWYAGGVHPPGARLTVADEDVDALIAQRVVSLATAENAASIDAAIAKGLPIPGYVVSAEDDEVARDPASGESSEDVADEVDARFDVHEGVGACRVVYGILLRGRYVLGVVSDDRRREILQ
jgi:hypothetical protein